MGTTDTIDLDPGCEEKPLNYLFPGDAPVFVIRMDCVPRNADSDSDGDVDLFDFTAFADCLSGPNPNACPADCNALDLDSDDDIDLHDFCSLQRVFAPAPP